MAKRAKRKAPARSVVCEVDPPMFVYFSREIIAERETLRRLAHRVVDLAVDSGRHTWLRAEVGFSLSQIARDQVIKRVTEFVQEACAEQKEATGG